MQRARLYGGVSFSDLAVAPGEIFPTKFKMSDLTAKYDGSGDPYIHLKIYIGKLGPCATDEAEGPSLPQKPDWGSLAVVCPVGKGQGRYMG